MKYRLLSFVGLCLVSMFAVADDLVGAWTLTTETERGPRTSEFVVRENDGALSGTLTGQRGALEIAEIKRDGDTFSFEAEITTQMGAMKLTYAGKLEAGSLSGVVGNPMGEAPFTGIRATVAAAE